MQRYILSVIISSLIAHVSISGAASNFNGLMKDLLGLQIEGKTHEILFDGDSTNFKQNPEELGGYFEGDIQNSMTLLRNAVINHNFHWKNGIIPVEVRGDFDSKDLGMISKAFEMYHNLTCIQFVQHSTEKDFVTIQNNPTGCWSSLGRIGGKQVLNLQSPLCLLKVGTIVHELMHVLGFKHEHTREDRDKYVEVNWKNIPTDLYVNFGKSTPNSTENFDIKYDYESVLHYSPFAFAIDSNKPSLVPLKKTGFARMGQRNGLSKSDISKIWKMYKCNTITADSLRKYSKKRTVKFFK